MTDLNAVKVFHLNRELLNADLVAIEQNHGVKILPEAQPVGTNDDIFYPQFPAAIRQTAKEMSAYYEVFYSLENWIRDTVSDALLLAHGENWWASSVPQEVRDNVANNAQRERDAAMSTRSEEQIDYTTFGELGVIIESNWDAFSDTFNNRKGVKSVLGRLNLLRGPIAHCSNLTEDEVLRLRLSLQDWFRLMQ
ncbi:MAG: Swt1 family HEPN domain-containing protein [Candidatus Planktophila sp.]|nr:Swt1 family HEPN domain-containing protein [Candidatus Planktophila sp.]